MGEVSRRLAEVRAAREQSKNEKRQQDDEERRPETDSERGARKAIIREAKAAGSTLDKPDAKGGLPPSMVLNAFRKCKYRCKSCGSKKNIGPHHIGGIVASPRLSRLGHKNKQSNLTILCAKCHDRAHEEARAQGVDSSQVLPEGDVGTKRDHGDKPVAGG